MSVPFSVSHVGCRPLGGESELEVVGAHVGDRLAGTLVVEAGHGEPLARLLRSQPVVDAARKAIGYHRGAGGLEDILGALDELAAALAAVDESPAADVPLAPPEPADPSRRAVLGVRPDDAIVEATNRLFYGNPEGKSGDSIFRAVAVAGVVLVATPEGPAPRAFGAFEGAFDALECWPALAWKLDELTEGIEAQQAAALLVRGR